MWFVMCGEINSESPTTVFGDSMEKQARRRGQVDQRGCGVSIVRDIEIWLGNLSTLLCLTLLQQAAGPDDQQMSFLPQWFDEVAHSPVLMPVPGEVHYSGFLGQRWFFYYDYYYVLYHHEQNKKYVSKLLPWHVSYRHTLCPEYNIIYFSVCTVEHFFFLLPCCKMSGCFSKQAITGKLCLSPNSFLSRIINLFLTFFVCYSSQKLTSFSFIYSFGLGSLQATWRK